MKIHRNSQKRIFIEGETYFVTAKTKNNYPYFKESVFCDLFVENLQICKQLKGFYLYAWVLMYDHFHLLFCPNEEFGLSKVIHNLKRATSLHINQTTEGEDIYPRLRFEWTNKLVKSRFKLLQKYNKNHEISHFQWQKSYHDHYIRNKQDFMNHWEYIKHNPERANMPKNWKYTFLNPEFEDLIDSSI